MGQLDDQAPSPAVARLQHLQTAQAQSKTQLEVAMKDTSAGGAEEVRTLKAQLQQAEHQIVEARTEVQQEVLAGGGGVPPQAAPTPSLNARHRLVDTTTRSLGTAQARKQPASSELWVLTSARRA